MAELAWPADLGHGTCTGRFGFMDADSHDPDREPDITSATGGTVTITPSIKSVRYTGAQGPMILAARPAKGIIDAEGYLCTLAADGSAGDRGMVFPATDDTDLTPTDWTYEVSIILDGQVRVGTFNVKLPEGATVDLSLAVPVPSSGGTAIVVDPTTAIRAEAAADRAEAAADEAEGYAPTFVWDGTALVIDGGDPVDLKGEKGDGSSWADLTGKPATYPPATHTHPITDVDGIVVDTSAGTRVSIGGVNVFYDSGWRDLRDFLIPDVLIPGERSHESLRARRSVDRVEYLVRLTVGPELAGKSRATRSPFAEGLPTFLEQKPAAYSTLGQANRPDGVLSVSNVGMTTRLDISSTQPGSWELGELVLIYVSHNTNAALPTSLPGTPA